MIRRPANRRPSIVLAVVAAAWVAAGCSPVSPTPATLAPSPGPAQSTPSAAPSVGPPPTPATSWTVIAGGGADVYHYKPATIVVPATQPVTVEFLDGDTLDHTWTVFGADGTTVLANLTVAKSGARASGTFTFPVPGTYEFWCTLPGHRGFGETGTLVVVP